MNLTLGPPARRRADRRLSRRARWAVTDAVYGDEARAVLNRAFAIRATN